MSSKSKSPPTEDGGNSTATPTLRFPEFHDADGWKATHLQKLARPVTERASTGDVENVLSLSGEHGLVLQSDYFAKKIAGDSTERYLRIRRDDFVYNDRTTKASSFGTIKRLSKYPGGIVSPIYKCFRFQVGENPIFWEWYFESGSHNPALGGLVNEGARTGRFNISATQFLSTRAWRPVKGEQNKIAACLTSLEALVEAQGEKVRALRTHKDGLRQQLFPQEGETQPRLRFANFRGAGDWNIEPLSNLARRVTTKNKLSNESRVLTNSAEYGIVDQRSYFDREIVTKNNLCNYYIVNLGDFVYNPRVSISAPVGPVSRNNIGTGVMSPLYTVFRFRNIATDFFAHLFKSSVWHSYLKNAANSGARHDRMNIATSDFMSVPLPVCNPDEQQQIADCLNSVDGLIAAETRKLEMLRVHKKGLMQQLFPSVMEDDA